MLDHALQWQRREWGERQTQRERERERERDSEVRLLHVTESTSNI
jgi:hypothetical protein